MRYDKSSRTKAEIVRQPTNKQQMPDHHTRKKERVVAKKLPEPAVPMPPDKESSSER